MASQQTHKALQASVAATAAMAGTYSLIVTNGNGCTSTAATTTVVVNAQPVATATSNNPVCAGTPLNLTGGPAGMAAAWTGPNGYTASTQNPTVSAATTAAMAGTYSLRVTNSSGCASIAATTTVVVNDQPVATATSNSPVCAGSELNLTGGTAGMTTYAWTGPDGYAANTQSPTVSAAATAAMACTYSLTVTNSNGCTNIAVTTVVVNPQGTWLGTTSTAWEDATNWCGGVPTSSTNVITKFRGQPTGNKYHRSYLQQYYNQYRRFSYN